MTKLFQNKNFLITGATGSFGKFFLKELIKKHYKELNQIIIFSRDELKQFDLQKSLGNLKKIVFRIGDIRDYERIKEVSEGVDIIVHAAALKQVPASEYN